MIAGISTQGCSGKYLKDKLANAEKIIEERGLEILVVEFPSRKEIIEFDKLSKGVGVWAKESSVRLFLHAPYKTEPWSDLLPIYLRETGAEGVIFHADKIYLNLAHWLRLLEGKLIFELVNENAAVSDYGMFGWVFSHYPYAKGALNALHLKGKDETAKILRNFKDRIVLEFVEEANGLLNPNVPKIIINSASEVLKSFSDYKKA